MNGLTRFHRRYPQDVEENLRWRRECRYRALTDLHFRHALYDACMEDLLFFMGFACWSYEPRARVKERPFIPWCHQEPVFLAIDKAVDDAERTEAAVDVLVDKSRAQGGTFGYLWIDLRRWLRDPLFAAGYVTRNENLVDSATDADTLFWKLAWGIERLPFWLQPRGFEMRKHRSLSTHSLLNPVNGATMVGYAAGQDVGAGGRKTVFTCDEFGAKDFITGGKDASVMEALHDVTHCIRMVSARYADAGVFHEACENPNHGGVHLVLDWKDNPIHSRLSYRVAAGTNVAVALRMEDQEAVNAYHREHPQLRRQLENRGYKFDGVVRSPWYDMRCLRPTASPRLIASQLDRNPRGAVGKVFQTEMLERVKKEACKNPVWRGQPVFDDEVPRLLGFLPRDDGPLSLWFKPGPDNSCPLGPFVLGCDMAVGTEGAYGSNSVVSGIDLRTGEQVLEYAIRGMPLIKFGRVAVGLALWLRNAYLGWEDSGMAAPFAKEVMEVQCYGNVYYREVAAIGTKKKTKKAGWWNGKDEHKADLFEKLALGMELQRYTPRSVDLVRECGEYEWEKGKIIHAPTKNRGSTEKAHGDRCIAAGVSWLLYLESASEGNLDSGRENDQTPEYGSWLWREERERTRVRNADDPDFCILDVIHA